MRKLLTIIVLAACMAGCTEKQMARQFGGNTTTVLPQGQKLVLVTWKEDNLWILTRPMKEGEAAETYTFKEDGSFGVMEGTATIKEQR